MIKNTQLSPQASLIMAGQQNEPILIGSHTRNNKNQQKINAGTLDDYLNNDQYKNSVLNPIKFLEQDWSVELNKEFMKGTILSRRKVKLVTDFIFYEFFTTNPIQALNNGTFYELLSLQENDFIFKKDSTGKIWAIPPLEVPIKPKLQSFDDYKLIFEAPRQQKSAIMQYKFTTYKPKILELIRAIENAQELTLTPTQQDLYRYTTSSISEAVCLNVLQGINLDDDYVEHDEIQKRKPSHPNKRVRSESPSF